MKIVVLDGYALNPGDLSWQSLEQVAGVEVHDRTPEDQIVPCSRSGCGHDKQNAALRGDARTTAAARYIGVLATGYNIVDTAAAKERGIVVTNIPTYGTASVAQFAMALLLDCVITSAYTARPFATGNGHAIRIGASGKLP